MEFLGILFLQLQRHIRVRVHSGLQRTLSFYISFSRQNDGHDAIIRLYSP